jgi:ABC-2 type transport system permease protein
LWDPDVRLFSRYEFEDPVSLGMGGFDLSRAIILVLPLVLIAVCFDVLSADRDANRLGLLLAQGAGMREMFWRKLAVRAGEILALTLFVSLVAALWPSKAASLAQRLPWFSLWAATFLLYAAFWIGIIAVVASRNRAGQANIIVLLLAWAVLTLIAPASMTSIAEAVYPTPSRAAYLSEARRVEIDTELAEEDMSKRMVLDHPEMLGGSASSIPDYVRTAFLVTAAVDDATRPVLANFQDAAERREATLAWVAALSPAAVVQRLFSDIAGTSSARHRRYMSQARALKAEYAVLVGPQVIAGRRLSVQQSKSFPVFEFEEESVLRLVRRSAGGLVFLGFVTCLLLIVADWRISRAQRAT